MLLSYTFNRPGPGRRMKGSRWRRQRRRSQRRPEAEE